jgi:hypothetical protein
MLTSYSASRMEKVEPTDRKKPSHFITKYFYKRKILLTTGQIVAQLV